MSITNYRNRNAVWKTTIWRCPKLVTNRSRIMHMAFDVSTSVYIYTDVFGDMVSCCRLADRLTYQTTRRRKLEDLTVSWYWHRNFRPHIFLIIGKFNFIILHTSPGGSPASGEDLHTWKNISQENSWIFIWICDVIYLFFKSLITSIRSSRGPEIKFSQQLLLYET